MQRHVQAEHIDPAGCLACEIDRRFDRIAAAHQKQRLLQGWRQDLPETLVQFEPIDIEEGFVEWLIVRRPRSTAAT